MRWAILFTAGLCCACTPQAGGEPDLAAAMSAARARNSEPAAALTVTADDVPEISAYLRDPDEPVRREAVVLLARAGGDAACTALAEAVTDNTADIRERAARAMRDVCSAETLKAAPELGPALRESVQLGNAAAAALLLRGRVPDGENAAFLESLLAAETPVVKLEAWHQPVPQGLAAAVAAANAGSSAGRERLVKGLEGIEEAEFLASVLGDIEETAALRSLLPLLDDERAVFASVPSGAQPQRRVCDLAADGFVKRLELNPFPLRPSDRYTTEEIALVKKLAAEAVAAVPLQP